MVMDWSLHSSFPYINLNNHLKTWKRAELPYQENQEWMNTIEQTQFFHRG